MKTKLLTFAFLIGTLSSFAQNKETSIITDSYLLQDNFYDISIGASALSNKSFFNEPQTGVNLMAGYRHETTSKKHAIGFMVALSSFTEQDDFVKEIKYNLLFVSPGIRNEFTLLQSKNKLGRLTSIFEVNYTITAFSMNYNDGDNYESLSIFDGGKLSIYLGYALRYKYFFMESGYRVNNPTVYFTDDYIDLFTLSENPITEDTQQMYFNTLIFRAGVSIPLYSFF